MKNVFLETDNVRRFRAAAQVLEDIEKGQPGLFVCFGRAGRGKTDCSREYAVAHNAIYIRVLQDWTPRAMLAEVCHAINRTRPASVEKCRNMIFHALQVSRRTLIVDEADRLNRVSMIEHFRDIHDVTGAPVILVGEQSLYATMALRRRLWSRVTQTVEFGPIKTEDIMLFGMKAADMKVDPDAAAMVGKRSGGDFRLIWQDMRSLESMARANGTAHVTVDMVKQLPDRKPKPSLEL